MKQILIIICLFLFGCASTTGTTTTQSGSTLQTLVDLWSKIKPAPTPVQTPIPSPAPTPQPEPVPVPAPPSIPSHVVICDFNLIPNQMRQQSWIGTDNQLYFALFSCAGNHEWGFVGSDPVAINLYNNCGNIKTWFDGVIVNIANQMKTNPNMSVTIIANDANDRGGLFMADPIKNRLLQLGVSQNQFDMGQIYNP